ncbi:hypothetical protein [Nocardioides marmotae]|uniref:WXG100 family type VII secretion target n=1 Tax=Nocardioides marmotae TaxID=2663857 RepID=A0A6I3JGJ1_9ACTN|nr:hypothetical protein [Nocardioides marmotae]MCR6033497.1 hypothetical protein [Gordonia jinghuaiqii]MBC9735024.1 hypothetical protein [Nocardioides marmotae]MTB86124.1 hypothetical protein [Nocardioides marmotae]MTB97155.1 hypothetical protein [Nocardioides marmotae]QKE00804.1 hypothetical protein HPC71_06735 [Nocardioides marmotae]
MGAESLIVAPTESTTAVTGLGPVESLVGCGNALAAGDWVEAGLMGVATGLETLGAIADPLGALLSAGIGWVIEHFGPLPGWLDDLAGDPDQIAAFAATWRNIADLVKDTSEQFLDAVASATSEWDGVAIDAYRIAAKAQAILIDAFGVAVDGVAAAVDVGGAIVAGVRELVRDAISQIVGYAISKVAQLLTVILAPKAIGEIVAKVGEWVAKLTSFIKGLINSMTAMSKHLDTLVNAASDGAAAIKRTADAWGRTNIANSRYNFDALLNGTATPGNGLPTIASVSYQLGGGAAKHGAGLDDR